LVGKYLLKEDFRAVKVCPRCHASHPDEFAFCPRDAMPLVEVDPWSFGSLHGGYQILDAIGGEGPGEGFRALHRESGERRIIRAFEGWWLASAPYAERFRQEIARAPLLQHPNAARVDGLFELPGDRPFVVEEEVWGPSLRQTLDVAKRPVAFPWACLLARQIAGALEAAHAVGLVHGAVRPSDVVFLDPVEPMEVKVLSFGFTALRESEERNELELFAELENDGDRPVPVPSPYTAPERLPVALTGSSEGPDPRSDLFSLGVLLFEILTGHLPQPWQGSAPQPKTTAEGRPVPAPLARFVGRLLEPDSDRRPRSARDVLAELSAAEEEMRRSVPGYLWEPGSAIRGRYRLLGEPVRGDLAERFAVRDLITDRRASLAALVPRLAAQPDLTAVFRRQGAALSSFHHESLDNVLATGEAEDGRPFLVQEEVRGVPLTWITGGRAPLELPRACRLLAGIARGLEALHRHGLCHGRLQADSILLVDTPFGERPRVLHLWEPPVRKAAAALRGEAREDPAGWTDLYALGVLAWETIARRPLFLAGTPLEALRRHLPAPVPPLATVCAGLPPSLDALVARLLAREPSRRPASAGEAAEELERLEEVTAAPQEIRRASLPPVGGRPAPSSSAGSLSGAPLLGSVGSLVAGRFRIERRIGGGSLGQVYAVTDVEEGDRWALKLLHRDRLGGVPAARVVQAMEPLIRLRHPGVVAVRAAGEAQDGSPFLLLEPVEGPDLLELTFPVTLEAICAVARDVTEALGAIHASGAVHGDLKPRHARLVSLPTGGRRWRLLDAGLAVTLASLVPGALAGTPGYFAPERIEPEAGLDPRSDLYSLGVLLHELLSGRLPDGNRPPLSGPRKGARIPERLQLLVLRLVEPDPRWRPASAREVVDELAAIETELRAEDSGDITAVLRSPLLKTTTRGTRTGRFLAARALQHRKTDPQAEQCYRAALLGDPGDPFLQAFLGRCLARQGRWGEAAEIYRRALRYDAYLEPVWGRLHETLEALGDGDGARAVREAGHAWWRFAAPRRRRIEGYSETSAATIAAVSFAPDGSCLASAGADGAVRLWNLRTGSADRILTGHEGGVHAIAFSPTAPLAASAGRDGTVRLWDLTRGTQSLTLRGHTDAVRAVTFSRDGRWVASGGAGGEVRAWEIDGLPLALYRFRSPINTIDFGPDGSLVHGSADGTMEIVRLDPVRPRLTLRAHGEPVTAAAFSPDGGLIASGSVDRTVKLWDAGTGDLVATLRGHDAAVSAVAFLPGGFLLASAGFDATVRLWDLFEGKLCGSLSAEAGFLTSLAVSPDGGTLAAGTDLPRIEIWEGSGDPSAAVDHHL
jgi:serine/threonine protein kinase